MIDMHTKTLLVDHQNFKIKLRNGVIVSGARLIGRSHEFPRMVYTDSETGLGVDVEVAWETALNLHTNNRPLVL